MDLPPPTADQIRARMQEIRRDLRVDVKEIAVHASRIFDWKNYVRSFPWGSLAAAAVVGYLLVPRRLNVSPPPAETVEAILREQQKLSPPQLPAAKASTLWGAVAPAVGTLVLRWGVNYATKAGLKLIEDFAQSVQPTKASVSRDSMESRGNRWPQQTRKS